MGLIPNGTMVFTRKSKGIQGILLFFATIAAIEPAYFLITIISFPTLRADPTTSKAQSFVVGVQHEGCAPLGGPAGPLSYLGHGARGCRSPTAVDPLNYSID